VGERQAAMSLDEEGQRLPEERFWWVRYAYRRHLACQQRRQTVPLGEAFFYAADEEQIEKHVQGWQHYIKHDQVKVLSIEEVPLGFHLHCRGLLKELSPDARILHLLPETEE
jgi:hypothetical protein